jgi:hypothetical protein
MKQVEIIPQFNSAIVAADAKIATGEGVVHTVTFSQGDAAPTAGSFTLYDNTTETGTAIISHTFTTDVFHPTTIVLDAVFNKGLYAGFDTTADVYVTITYKQ